MTNGRKQCDVTAGCGKLYKQSLTACPSCGASDAFSALIPFNPLDWVYDLESYPNIFTADFIHPNTGTRYLFEISDRRNDLTPLMQFLISLRDNGCRMIGFNSIGYDYPMIHFIIENAHLNPTVNDIYNKNQSIIDTPWALRFTNQVWENEHHIIQIDLFKIHHFDNDSRRTSLKMLEFNMMMDSIDDLPYPPGTVLDYEQKNELIVYNDHDVDATKDFYIESIDMIEFREQLSEKYNSNYLNHNDKKIGTSYLINELERIIPGSCYTRDINNRKVVKQTQRPTINLGDVIFPYIKFNHPEFKRVRQWLAAQTITETKGVFNDLSATVDGFTYDFGTGGIHGSIDPTIVYSDNDYELWDWDVTSFYPRLAIVNNLYPEHLSSDFCSIYNNIFDQRRQHKKGTALNLALKLALNGAYGDSNSKYSPFYDPKFTMSITINGQLLLCLLSQYLTEIPGLTMVQANTDGVTVLCPRNAIDQMKTVCKWWEAYTCLELEHVTYSRMFIRDVNNYIAETTDGKVKRKGAYAYERISDNAHTQERQWHQNHSALIVPKAAEAALMHGADISEFIRNHSNIYDFMLRTKVNRADKLMLNGVTELQRITRYYISNDIAAGALTKISPPAKKYKVGQWKRANGLTDQFYNSVRAEITGRLSDVNDLDVDGIPWDERINTKSRTKYEMRETSINAGWLVMPCNNIHTFNRSNIDYDYYIKETEKLVNPLRGIK